MGLVFAICVASNSKAEDHILLATQFGFVEIADACIFINKAKLNDLAGFTSHFRRLEKKHEARTFPKGSLVTYEGTAVGGQVTCVRPDGERRCWWVPTEDLGDLP
jgi:hypothetical protein